MRPEWQASILRRTNSSKKSCRLIFGICKLPTISPLSTASPANSASTPNSSNPSKCPATTTYAENVSSLKRPKSRKSCVIMTMYRLKGYKICSIISSCRGRLIRRRRRSLMGCIKIRCKTFLKLIFKIRLQ